MADILLPPSLNVARAKFRYIDSTGISRNKYTGVIRTASLGGDRLGASIEMTPQGGLSASGKNARATLTDFLASLRGRQNRALLWDRAYSIRGNFPTAELITNPEFGNGTVGYAAGGQSTISVTDRTLRILRNQNLNTKGHWAAWNSISGLGSYVPFVWRFSVSAIYGGAIPWATCTGAILPCGPYSNGAQLTDAGVSTLFGVSALSPSGSLFIDNNAAGGPLAGSYFDVNWASCTQCMLADAPDNLLTDNLDFSSANWTKSNLTVTANATSAPDGSVTADKLIPNTTGGVNHYVTQTAIPLGGVNTLVANCGCFKAAGYNFVNLYMTEIAGGSSCYQVFNLGTGALGVSASTGANWADRRAFIVDIGNGWYFCCVIARTTNAATTLSAYNFAVNADTGGTFAGDGTSGIYAWGSTVQLSGVSPQIVRNSGSSAVSGSSIAAGTSSMNVKGLPASTAGLLLAGDQVEIFTSLGSELKLVTGSVDSDAAGRGVLQFLPPLRGSVVNNQPVIVSRPIGRFVFSGNALEWANEPGVFTSASLEFEEAVG